MKCLSSLIPGRAGEQEMRQMGGRFKDLLPELFATGFQPSLFHFISTSVHTHLLQSRLHQ